MTWTTASRPRGSARSRRRRTRASSSSESSSRSRTVGGRAFLIATGILLAWGPSAFALNPTLDVGQYGHTAWKVSDGFFSGVIRAIAQTPDGHIWIGTDSGLFRFDGVRSVRWEPPAGSRLPSSDVRRLHTARDGRLWIGTTGGLASWKDGTLTRYPDVEGRTVVAVVDDREGTTWVGTWGIIAGGLCTIRSGKTECQGEDGRFGSGVTALYEDNAGNLWAGATTGLWRLKPGPPEVFAVPDRANGINALIESDDGGILAAQDSGVTKLRNGRAEAFPLPAGLDPQSGHFLRDRHGALWMAAVGSGLLHFHEGRSDLFTRSDGLSGSTVSGLLEDREGNIWAATVDGLDRFRDLAVATLSVGQGLSSHAVASVLAAKDGSVWMGTARGLNRWKDGELTVYRKPRRSRSVRGSSAGAATAGGTVSLPVREITDDRLPGDAVASLFEDSRGRIWVATHDGVAILESDRFLPVGSVPRGIVFAIAEDRTGSVWLSHREGLFRVLGPRVVERIAWATLGSKEPATALLCDDSRDGLWLGFPQGAVARFSQGRITATVATGKGLGSLHLDPKGRLWASTYAGLSRIDDTGTATLTSQNGLPCDAVHWMMEDDAGFVWLSTACGLVRMAQSGLDAWLSDAASRVQGTVFDSTDGMRTQQFHYGYTPVVTRSTDGRLWFLPFGGVSVIDPRHLPANPVPPPVHIEQLTADGRTYEASTGLQLPAGARDLLLEFTALTFVLPEKVRFRVKLEGQDADWRDLVNQRRVHYTNLPPRTYRFRVLAANNSGVWNEQGAALEFVIPPMWYQTGWARVLAAAALLALLWAAYQLRVRQLAHRFNLTLDARVAERTRIARELHDTLLQSFHGLLLQFQTVSHLLTERPSEAKEHLDRAIERAAEAITEGRNSVQGLRASSVERNDLAVAIRTYGEELATHPGARNAPTLTVDVEGHARDLHPIVRDEIYKIAAEALRNAFRHAEAARVEVEIHYEDGLFRLRVRDDGKGIDPAVLAQQGLEGHYGLRGMPERAALIRGKLRVWSEVDAGTEVELRVPGRAAYTTVRTGSSLSRFAAKIGLHVGSRS